MRPPTIFELMQDPQYEEFIDTAPETTVTYAGITRPHPGLTTGDPWAVWVRTTTGRWKYGEFATYERTLEVFNRAYDRDDTADVAIVSKRVLFTPPGEYRKVRVRRPATATRPETTTVEERWRQTYFGPPGFQWCPRCRRPSAFRLLPFDHHALRRQAVLTDDSPRRCVMCGIREASLPNDHMWVKS